MAVEQIHIGGDDFEFIPDGPLQILHALPPEPSGERAYTVELQLNREATMFEQQYVSHLRSVTIEDDRLLIEHTTIEEVQRDPGKWSRLVADVSQEGEFLRKAEEKKVTRKREAVEAERKRLAEIAASIEF